MSDCIYLDYHATTPVDPRVLEAMLPFFTERFGNVASQHRYGRDAKLVCDEARSQVAALMGVAVEEVVFTSGATESNNFAIKGVAEAMAGHGRHIISCVTEHKSVLDTLKYLEKRGYAITLLPVDSFGQVSVKAVNDALRLGANGTDRTILVTLMGANNEIGTLHPIKAIGELLTKHDIMFHVDAAQTVGKIPFDVKALGIDLLSISGHKIYGPKGIGALYVNKCLCRDDICTIMHGGGQESGLRAGTLPVPMVVGLGKAAEIARLEINHEVEYLGSLRDRLQTALRALGGVVLNGHPLERLPGNLNVTFKDIDGDRMMLGLKNIAVSSSSACTSAAATSSMSHVLKAIGRTDDDARSTLRFGLGRFTTAAEIDQVIGTLVPIIERLRRTQMRLSQKQKNKFLTAN